MKKGISGENHYMINQQKKQKKKQKEKTNLVSADEERKVAEKKITEKEKLTAANLSMNWNKKGEKVVRKRKRERITNM